MNLFCLSCSSFSPSFIYLFSEPNKVLGFIKTGEKKLFLHDHKGKMREVTPTCVLDFYVHESCQRMSVTSYFAPFFFLPPSSPRGHTSICRRMLRLFFFWVAMAIAGNGDVMFNF